jgi:hypothetical protein
MSPLHQFGEAVRQLLLQVPLGVARALFVFLLIALLVWVLTLPRAQTTPPNRKPRLGENLKLWASLALLIQILIYAFLSG